MFGCVSHNDILKILFRLKTFQYLGEPPLLRPHRALLAQVFLQRSFVKELESCFTSKKSHKF